jgi:hypothetical protein
LKWPDHENNTQKLNCYDRVTLQVKDAAESAKNAAAAALPINHKASSDVPWMVRAPRYWQVYNYTLTMSSLCLSVHFTALICRAHPSSNIQIGSLLVFAPVIFYMCANIYSASIC